jgi:hypothetical protein
VKKKILLALLCMPVLFAIWYYCSPLIAMITGFVVAHPANWLSGGLITSVDYAGVLVHGTITVAEGTWGELVVPAGQTAELSISARPMVYGYSIPLFFTLLFAFSSRPVAGYLKWSALLVLLLGISFGTLMELLKTVYFNLDPALLPNGPLGSIASNMLAVCYQMGALIFPSILPVVLWFSLSGRELFGHYFSGQNTAELADHRERGG